MKYTFVADTVTKYGKPDLERLGVFIEMPYLSPKQRKIPKKAPEPLNFKGSGPKIKDATDVGYFDPFKRLFTGECLKGRGRKPKKSMFKPVSKLPLRPPAGSKLHSTPGDYYGCFSGNIEAFSNKRRIVKKGPRTMKNFYTSPGKKGNAGYADICINKYPECISMKTKKTPPPIRPLNGPLVTNHYTKDYFDENSFRDDEGVKGRIYVRPKERAWPVIPPGYLKPTGKGKKPGGCHDGCFDKWPEHKSDRITGKPKLTPPLFGPFYPQSRLTKTIQYFSTVNLNTDFRLNEVNYKTYEPTYLTYLVN